MTRYLGYLPGTELGKNTLGQGFALVAKPGHFLIDIDFGIVADVLQLFYLCFKLGNWLLKIQEFQVHSAFILKIL